MHRLRIFLASLLAAGVIASATPPAKAATRTVRFQGTVSATGTRYIPHSLSLTGPTVIDATLNWTTTTADLNLVLKNGSNTVMAQTTSPTKRPETIRYEYTGTAPATWKIMAFARSGRSAYTIDVTLQSGDVVEPPPPPPPTTWNGTINVWMAENESHTHDWTEPQARDLARKFQAFITIPRSFRNHVAAMKQENPNLLLFGYVNGTHIGGNDTTAWPPDAFLYDKDGNKVKSARFGSYNMNIYNQPWIDSRPTTCRKTLELSGYDNCYVDSLATWGFTDVVSPPVYPGTDRLLTKAEWLDGTTNIGRAVNNGDGTGKPLLVSGAFTARQYWGTTNHPAESVLLDAGDASIHEGFCRNPNGAITTFYPEDWWKQEVEMIRDIEARGKFALPLTKAWVNGTAAQKDAAMKYCLGTFLLGTNGRSMFSFTWDKGDAAHRWAPLWETVLGAPSAPYATYQKVDGAYQRTFTNGRVLVNSTTAATTIGLAEPYRRPSGEVVTSVALAPKTAEILTK